ncbi:GIY-YIG nuclease family protein [Corynebacterium sp. AOP40-4SA-5]|uniref:GIY-YIG nuclease family protein n=1 Tax=Corynebacterium sp. AOP40-4SA-5 TaxID=3457678 RepID=UPI00403452BE
MNRPPDPKWSLLEVLDENNGTPLYISITAKGKEQLIITKQPKWNTHLEYADPEANSCHLSTYNTLEEAKRSLGKTREAYYVASEYAFQLRRAAKYRTIISENYRAFDLQSKITKQLVKEYADLYHNKADPTYVHEPAKERREFLKSYINEIEQDIASIRNETLLDDIINTVIDWSGFMSPENVLCHIESDEFIEHLELLAGTEVVEERKNGMQWLFADILDRMKTEIELQNAITESLRTFLEILDSIIQQTEIDLEYANQWKAQHAVRGYWVYLALGTDGKVLYVGQSNSIFHRMAEHSNTSKWFYDTDRLVIEYEHTRERALAREKDLIKMLRPPYNIIHNNDNQ